MFMPVIFADNVGIWKINEPEEPIFQIQDVSVCGMVFSEDDQLFAVGEESYQLTIWDVATLTLVSKLSAVPTAPFEYPSFIEFGADNATLLTAGLEGPVLVWDLKTTEIAFSFDHHYLIRTFRQAVCYDRRRNRLAMCMDRSKVVFRGVQAADDLQLEINTRLESIQALALNSDCSWVAASSSDGIAYIWDTLNGNEVFAATDTEGLLHIYFTPDSSHLFALRENRVDVPVWDISNKTLLRVLHVATALNSISMCPFDGGLVALCFADLSTVVLMDPRTGRECYQISTCTTKKGKNNFPHAAEFSHSAVVLL